MARVELSSNLDLDIKQLIENNPKLKSQVRGKIATAVKSGKVNGSNQYSLEQMKNIARYDFLYMLIDNMPATLRDSLNRSHYGNPALFGAGIKVTDPKPETQADGTIKYVLSIEFDEKALFRKSLCESKYPEGEPDILASFNFGFTVSGDNRAFGYWDTADKNVWGLKHRAGLHFLEQTINDFNSQYRAQGCYAVLGDDYS